MTVFGPPVLFFIGNMSQVFHEHLQTLALFPGAGGFDGCVFSRPLTTFA